MRTNFNAMALIGRVLLALVFLLSGIGKLRGFDGTMAYISSVGLPLAGVLAALALALEIVAGVALILGYRTRWAALALAAFTLVAAFLFHNFWSMPVAGAGDAADHVPQESGDCRRPADGGRLRSRRLERRPALGVCASGENRLRNPAMCRISSSQTECGISYSCHSSG